MDMLTLLKKRIDESPARAIPFYEYMRICLYEPEFGYYMKPTPKIGKSGDFYTSSNIGTVMGEVLARFVAKTAREHAGGLESIMLAEWGGGTGRLASQVLDELRRLDEALYAKIRFVSFERSPYHQACQREALAAHLDKLSFGQPEDVAAGYVIGWANELLDAFPCRRYRRTIDGLDELHVGWDAAAESPCAIWTPADASAAERLRSVWHRLAPGQQFERQPDVERWFAEAAQAAERMTVAVIDYGDSEEELLAGHRMNGTFLCYRNHEAKDAPFEAPGEADMTVHVNFTQCRQAAAAAGFREARVEPQKQFLLDNGLLELLQDHAQTDPFHPIARKNRAVRQLLLSDQMSELFKVMTISK